MAINSHTYFLITLFYLTLQRCPIVEQDTMCFSRSSQQKHTILVREGSGEVKSKLSGRSFRKEKRYKRLTCVCFIGCRESIHMHCHVFHVLCAWNAVPRKPTHVGSDLFSVYWFQKVLKEILSGADVVLATVTGASMEGPMRYTCRQYSYLLLLGCTNIILYVRIETRVDLVAEITCVPCTLCRYLPDEHFDLVVIDECAQV